MRDIVATIQAEQDEIIRLNHPEMLVIEGGPGTGKTVLVLHRVILLGVLRRGSRTDHRNAGCRRVRHIRAGTLGDRRIVTSGAGSV
jgi:hypothetical protein